jgi:type IV pilus assembly protein PilE
MAGVTLIELMIVVIVIAVLGTIALPSYRQYAVRSQRTEAKIALLQLSTNQERFYLHNRRYGGTADLAALGFPTGKSDRGAYALTIPVASSTTYTATATAAAAPRGAVNMADDAECTSFSIDAHGARTAAPDPSRRCW